MCLRVGMHLYILAAETELNPNLVKPVNPIVMKRRVRKIANFFAFNLLFFALYLNFIHKDKAPVNFAGEQTAVQQNTAAFSGTVLLDNPQENNQPAAKTQDDSKTEDGTALKLSIN
jgi:hypothetical protein